LKARQHNNQKKKGKKSLKMPKGAIRSRNLKVRQHNNQRKKDKKSLKMPLSLSFFFWLMCCQAFKLRLLIAPFGFLKLLLSFFFWLLCCLAFKLRLLPKGSTRSRNLKARQHNNRKQAFLVLFRLVIVLSGLQITASDYPFGVFNLFVSFFFWLLCCLAFKLRLLITNNQKKKDKKSLKTPKG
jgi:hypothetical protein